MYIKLFPHGKGLGRQAVEYLTRLDYPQRAESPPLVLRGDPAQTIALIETQERIWKFSAGVLSWGPKDTITPEQERRLMDDFERTAFAGLEPDQYDILWVRHSHAGHHELHFVTPRMELSAGKALNAFPPGWQKDFDVLRDLYNWQEGWTRPDDPARARVRTPDHADVHCARLKRWGKETGSTDADTLRSAITDYLVQRITNGLVETRADSIQAVHELGLQVPRQGKDYITVLVPENGQRVRLKGGIFCEDWRVEQQSSGTLGIGQATLDGSRQAHLARLAPELERIRAKRAGYHRARYAPTQREIVSNLGHELDRVGRTQSSFEPQRVEGFRLSFSGSQRGIVGSGFGGVGHSPLVEAGSQTTARAGRSIDHTKARIGGGFGTVGEKDMGRISAQGQGGDVCPFSPRHGYAKYMDSGQASPPQVGEINHDRIANYPQGHTGPLGAGYAKPSERAGSTNQPTTRDYAPLADTANTLGAAFARLEQLMREFGKLVAAFEQYRQRQVELLAKRGQTRGYAGYSR